jgi:DNA-binding response OmpR family regulator
MTEGGAKIRLLLVDDRQDFLDILSERLSRRGYEVTTATSGWEALDAVEQQSFDVAVLDVVMPAMDGLETLTRMRVLAPDLPVLMLTGYSTADKASELGAVEVLIKPTALETLMERVEAAIAAKPKTKPKAGS